MKFAILFAVLIGLAGIPSPVHAEDDPAAKPPAGQTDAQSTDFKPLPDDYRPPELLCGGGGLCGQTQGASVDMLKARREEARSGAAADLEGAGKALVQAHLHLAAVICTGDVAQAMNELAAAMSNLDTAADQAARVSTAVETENLAVDRAQVAVKGYGAHGQKNFPEQKKAENALIKASEQRDKAVEQEKAKLKSQYGVTSVSSSGCPATSTNQDTPETPTKTKLSDVPPDQPKTANPDAPKTGTPSTGKMSSEQKPGKPRKERKKVISAATHSPAREGLSPEIADAVITGVAVGTAVGGTQRRHGMDGGGGPKMSPNRGNAGRPGTTMNTTVGSPSFSFGR
jgi:hypothetical protein